MRTSPPAGIVGWVASGFTAHGSLKGEGDAVQETVKRAAVRSGARSSSHVRVLFVHPSDELYGSDVVLLSLLAGLDRSRFTPYVVLANDLPYQGLLSAELEKLGIATFHMPLAVARRKYLTPTGLPQFYARQIQAQRMVAEFIQSHDIDVVYSNTLAVWAGALAAKRTKRPHVWHIHETLENPKPLVSMMRRFVPSHSVRVVGVSGAVLKNILVTPEARAKGVVIYNGMDPHIWLTAPGRNRVRLELGIRPDDVAVGMVARISKMKAPDLAVQAISPLMKQYTNLHCFLAGGPVLGQTEVLAELEQLVATSAAPERFHLLGERRDAPDLMAAMDMLIAPSRYGEGASLTIIQALFAGKPVVATDAGGNSELVVQGESGYIVPAGNTQALAQALIRLVDDVSLRESMGKQGYQRAMRLFTLDHQIEEFHAILNEVVRA